MRRFALFALVATVCGCTDLHATRQAELAAWVGRPEVALVQVMGAPARTYETSGMKFLTYEDRRFEIVPGLPVYPGLGPFWYGGAGFPPTAINLACDTTFTISGVVRAYSLRGNACG